jgi:hypothetical protein
LVFSALMPFFVAPVVRDFAILDMYRIVSVSKLIMRVWSVFVSSES